MGTVFGAARLRHGHVHANLHTTGWRVGPPQAVLFQPEAKDRPRRGCERVESAERVVNEARVNVFSDAYGAADLGLRLENQHRTPLVEKGG